MVVFHIKDMVCPFRVGVMVNAFQPNGNDIFRSFIPVDGHSVQDSEAEFVHVVVKCDVACSGHKVRDTEVTQQCRMGVGVGAAKVGCSVNDVEILD